MSIAQQFRTAMTSDPTVAGLVGAKVYRHRPPQDAVGPYVVFVLISDAEEETLGGQIADGGGKDQIQVDCWASDLDAAQAIYNAVNPALRASPDFSLVKTNRREDFDEDVDLYRISVDYSVTY